LYFCLLSILKTRAFVASLFDLFLCSQRSDGRFENQVSIAAPGLDSSISFAGCGFGDIDNDGDLDIFMLAYADGGISTIAYNNGPAKASLDGYLSFAVENLEVGGRGRGMALADFNNDGFLDLVASQFGTPNNLLLSTGHQPAVSFFCLKLTLTSPTHGLPNLQGTVVFLHAIDEAGQPTLVATRVVEGGGGYASGLPYTIHFAIPETIHDATSKYALSTNLFGQMSIGAEEIDTSLFAEGASLVLQLIDEPPPADRYLQMDVGNCLAAGYQPILSKSDCQLAAKTLGLSDENADASQDETKPGYCYWRSDAYFLVWSSSSGNY
jgi:hypothetical protein